MPYRVEIGGFNLFFFIRKVVVAESFTQADVKIFRFYDLNLWFKGIQLLKVRKLSGAKVYIKVYIKFKVNLYFY